MIYNNLSKKFKKTSNSKKRNNKYLLKKIKKIKTTMKWVS